MYQTRKIFKPSMVINKQKQYEKPKYFFHDISTYIFKIVRIRVHSSNNNIIRTKPITDSRSNSSRYNMNISHYSTAVITIIAVYGRSHGDSRHSGGFSLRKLLFYQDTVTRNNNKYYCDFLHLLALSICLMFNKQTQSLKRSKHYSFAKKN